MITQITEITITSRDNETLYEVPVESTIENCHTHRYSIHLAGQSVEQVLEYITFIRNLCPEEFQCYSGMLRSIKG